MNLVNTNIYRCLWESTAPEWFQWFTEATFTDFIFKKTLEVYLGDTIVDTLTVQEHGAILEQIFEQKPTTQKGLPGWLGDANYLSKYIPEYAQVKQPLYNLEDQKNVPKYLRKRNGAPNGKKF